MELFYSFFRLCKPNLNLTNGFEPIDWPMVGEGLNAAQRKLKKIQQKL